MDYSFGSVVFRKDAVVEYLLVHHAGPGHWDFPKGHPDDGESPEQTAAREVLEETNSTIEFVPGFAERIEYLLPRGERKQVTFFLAEYTGEGTHPIDPDEIAGLAWFPYPEALQRITFDNSKHVIEAADDFLRKQTSG